jgi:TorA maturation chaperone TorD
MSAPPGIPTPSEVAPAPGAADAALCRSALWEALALGFRVPTAETVARLATPEGAGALADAAAVVDDGATAGLVPLVRALAAAPAPPPADLRDAHDRLFGHTARGAVPPYETEYGEDSQFQPQRDMADLGAFLRAFGLALRPDARERADHVACECELMLVLARKEAHALQIGDAAMAEITQRAGRLFLRDHLGRWAPAFGRALARQDPDGFHGRLGALCTAFVTAECGRLGVPAGPPLLRLRAAQAPDVPMACGGGPGSGCS